MFHTACSNTRFFSSTWGEPCHAMSLVLEMASGKGQPRPQILAFWSFTRRFSPPLTTARCAESPTNERRAWYRTCCYFHDMLSLSQPGRFCVLRIIESFVKLPGSRPSASHMKRHATLQNQGIQKFLASIVNSQPTRHMNSAGGPNPHPLYA
jgi:hypothetical protein